MPKGRQLLITVLICGAVICYATVILVKLSRMDASTVQDQAASMEHHDREYFKQFQLNHTAIVLNGNVEKLLRVQDGNLTIGVKNGSPLHRGIAFSVGRPGYFLTALHCVADHEAIHLIPRRPRQRPKSLEQFRAMVVWQSAVEHDLVLLKAESLELPPLQLASDLPDIGTPIVSLGYQLSAGKVIDATTSDAIDFTEATLRGAVTKLFFIRSTAPVMAGDSGGPLINLQGEVLGVNQSYSLECDHVQAYSLRGDVPTAHAGFPNPQELISLIQNHDKNTKTTPESKSRF